MAILFPLLTIPQQEPDDFLAFRGQQSEEARRLLDLAEPPAGRLDPPPFAPGRGVIRGRVQGRTG